MKICLVTEPEFTSYGKVANGYDVGPFLAVLESATPLPAGTAYVPKDDALQSLPAAERLGRALFGGLPVQFGWCNGHNTRLNCLEYHRSSEFLLGTEAFVLLLAKREQMEGGMLDTSWVKAFLVPRGTVVELYATTLHFAPCQTEAHRGFRVMVVLPEGTNLEKPDIAAVTQEDAMLLSCNKWLLAHSESTEAQQGAWIGLTGPNIDIAAKR